MGSFLFKDRKISLGDKTQIMGIINVTPDSFSDSGDNSSLDRSISCALEMVQHGADIIDVGGESTRPGSTPVSAQEELQRVVPFIEGLRSCSSIPISIDTWKSSVAEAALIAGADIINDVSGFHRDLEMKNIAAEFQAGCIAMHMRGTPQTMQSPENLIYTDLIEDICSYFRQTTKMLLDAGVRRGSIMFDPGVGFSKNTDQNLSLIKHVDRIRALGFPVLLGASRKSFIGNVLSLVDPRDRLWGTAAAICCGINRGANVVRVHDVREMSEVSLLTDHIRMAD